VSTQPTSFITPEQYLEIERKSEYKREYHQGEMFAMAGAPESREDIAGNVFAAFHREFRGGRSGCRVFSSNTRLYIPATGLYTYADVVAVCGERRYQDGRVRDTLLNPTLIVEVLSPSTEAYDRGQKFDHYKSVDSVRQYLLIAVNRIHADLFTRQSDNLWTLVSAAHLEDSLDLESVGCKLSMADVYENVDLAQ
jgi:Uma2 family endonuclease